MRDHTQLRLHQAQTIQQSRSRLWKEIAKHKYLYVLVVPTILFYVLFSYLPMYGIVLAFKEFDYSLGITGSPWIGFQNFADVFANPDFLTAFRNTILISFGRLIIEFPAPIILALLLNEISKGRLTRVIQTVFTFPHFISWVVISGIVVGIFSSQGLYNQILSVFGFESQSVLTDGPSFTAVLFLSNIWKEAGWSAILYLAAIAGINPELYEAAAVDGANRFQQMKAITWPVVRSTAAVLLILAVGNIMNGGFDQIFNLYNPAVYNYSDILDTLVYRSAFQDATGFGFSTTVGFLKSVINCALLFAANYFIKTVAKEEGL
ncbi:ABC transporter permease [Paenibacillus alkalitolerans]|uniref:ABC transporter permease n=1 Tax=Paenibacillus alkalitolerans TaxID=2799335 RepID=UPI0018F506B6|nr:ABC transporter permease subunit [Paenibacillus alkalitolerans]